jgi:hypothetical protein
MEVVMFDNLDSNKETPRVVSLFFRRLHSKKGTGSF